MRVVVPLALLLILSHCSGVHEIEQLSYPRDLLPHRSQIEWWYQTGVLNGGKLSYELTVFKAYKPEDEKWPKFLGIPVGEIWVIHAMFHDHSSGRRLFIERALLPPFVFVGSGMKVLSDGMLCRCGDLSLFVDLRDMSFTLESSDLSMDLHLEPLKPPVYHGGGLVKMEKGESYYLSLTRVKVKGEVRAFGRVYEVEGETWVDRQWGDFEVSPWDWLSVRLKSGEEIMLFHFPRSGLRYGTIIWKDGSITPVEDFDLALEGSVVDPDGDAIPIPNPGRFWSDLFDLIVTVVSTNQLNPSLYTPPYFEGLCTVEGTLLGNRVKGRAFFEGWR